MVFLDPQDPSRVPENPPFGPIPLLPHPPGTEPTPKPPPIFTDADQSMWDLYSGGVQRVRDYRRLRGEAREAVDAATGSARRQAAAQAARHAGTTASRLEYLDRMVANIVAAGGLSPEWQAWAKESCITQYFSYWADSFFSTMMALQVEITPPVIDLSPDILGVSTDRSIDIGPTSTPSTPQVPIPTEYPDPFPDEFPATPWSPGGEDVFPGTPPIDRRR